MTTRWARNRAPSASDGGSAPTMASGAPSSRSSSSSSTPSSDPKPSRCDIATLVVTVDGRLDDRPGAPQFTPHAGPGLDDQGLGVGRCRQDGLGIPTRLLSLAGVACTRYLVRSTAAHISLVLVLPLAPPMASTGPRNRPAPGPGQPAIGLERIGDVGRARARAPSAVPARTTAPDRARAPAPAARWSCPSNRSPLSATNSARGASVRVSVEISA